MCTCMAFLYQFSWNSHCLTSLLTNSYTIFHLNWSINVECKDRNLFMPLSFHSTRFHNSNVHSMGFCVYLLYQIFFPTWTKNVENRAKIMYTPIIKVWRLLYNHSWNSQLHRGMTLRSRISKFCQISQQMWEVLLELY